MILSSLSIGFLNFTDNIYSIQSKYEESSVNCAKISATAFKEIYGKNRSKKKTTYLRTKKIRKRIMMTKAKKPTTRPTIKAASRNPVCGSAADHEATPSTPRFRKMT